MLYGNMYCNEPQSWIFMSYNAIMDIWKLVFDSLWISFSLKVTVWLKKAFFLLKETDFRYSSKLISVLNTTG